ncbi:AAA family ATPase [Ectopseudomonas chengduensis]|nr:AAA family ATPase [Pseudomonas chengduensis]WKC38070.1 AAA family ATPase [Pseudomonas chengduensis]
MSTIKSIALKNYKCFRKRTAFSLSGATYLIGANNSGKSAVLQAMRDFFSHTPISKDELNSTELRSKQAGHNKCEIEVTFALTKIKKESKKIKQLKKDYPHGLTVRKIYTYKESTQDVEVHYEILGHIKEEDKDNDSIPIPYLEIPEDIRWFLSRHTISYIHPQDSEKLLAEAESKLRKRLINTFGKGKSFIMKMKVLEDSWKALREDASRSLSENLTTALQTVWVDAVANVDLPERIQDVLAISSISFKQSPTQPEILLNKQGNGVQATVLFQAHYILDSDKTAHHGFHQPIWLVEEPETFLHADIALKLGQMLTSPEWLSNIQILATTHSPLMLAASNQNSRNCGWTLIKNFTCAFEKTVEDITNNEISEISSEIGDTNLDIYLDTNSNIEQTIIEDSRDETQRAYERSGITITRRLNGSAEIKKLLDVIVKLKFPPRKRMTIILDQDSGIKEIKKYLSQETIVKTKSDFTLHKIEENVYILLLPFNEAAEDLFEQYDDFLGEIADKLFDDDYQHATSESVPANLTRAHAAIRNRQAGSRQEAKKLLAKEQDAKDIFWKTVKIEKYTISSEKAETIKELLIEK